MTAPEFMGTVAFFLVTALPVLAMDLPVLRSMS
jgi:hypothetical protein